MEKVLFLMSHLGSGSDKFYQILKAHPKIDDPGINIVYENYEDIEYLRNKPHKVNNVSAIYMQHILYNHQFVSKKLCRLCNFVFYLGNPRSTISRIIQMGYSESNALNYYNFRLYGLYVYYIRSYGNNLIFSSNWSELSKFLDIDTLSGYMEDEKEPDNVSMDTLLKAEDVYFKYIIKFNR